jgi:hypothetical protein
MWGEVDEGNAVFTALSAYFRLKKIPCGFKEQARARHPGEKCGLAADKLRGQKRLLNDAQKNGWSGGTSQNVVIDNITKGGHRERG